MQEIADNLPIMDGADRLMHTLKNVVINRDTFWWFYLFWELS